MHPLPTLVRQQCGVVVVSAEKTWRRCCPSGCALVPPLVVPPLVVPPLVVPLLVAWTDVQQALELCLQEVMLLCLQEVMLLCLREIMKGGVKEGVEVCVEEGGRGGLEGVEKDGS